MIALFWFLLFGERDPIVIDLCEMTGFLVIPGALVFGMLRARKAAR